MSLFLVFTNFTFQDAKWRRWLFAIIRGTGGYLRYPRCNCIQDPLSMLLTYVLHNQIPNTILIAKSLLFFFFFKLSCLKQQLIKTTLDSLLPFLSVVPVQHKLEWPRWIICLWVKVVIPCQCEHNTAFEANRSLAQGRLRDHTTSL